MKSNRYNAFKRFAALDCWMLENIVVDPDFDDDWHDTVLYRHDIETHGAIALHPDGNRLSGDFDPVPLQAHDSPGPVRWTRGNTPPPYVYVDTRWYEQRARERESMEQIQENDRLYREREEQRKRARDRERVWERVTTWHGIPAKPVPPPSRPWFPSEPLVPPPRPGIPEDPLPPPHPLRPSLPGPDTPVERYNGMLRAMRFDVPVARGAGRIWQEFVMVNESDLAELGMRWGPEIWRGHGYVIFRMRTPGA